MKEFLYIHKNGLALRKVAERDLDLLLELKTESWFGTHTIAFLNEDDQREWFQSERKNPNSLYLMVYDTTVSPNIPVGLYVLAHIDWISRSVEDGHHVFKESRGKGYGFRLKEAGVDFVFEVLNTNRISVEVLDNNQASITLTERVGFVQEGTFRQAVYRPDGYHDSLMFALLREDWVQLPRVLAYKGMCNVSYVPKNEKR